MNIVSRFFDLFRSALKVVLESDMKVISDDAEKLLSDNENKAAYLEALRQLRELEKNGVENPKVNINLKGNKTLELSR